MQNREHADAELTILEVYAYLRVHDSAQGIDFYERAFGAKELFRLTEPSGRIDHAEIKIGPTTLMLSDEYPESGIRGPRSIGATTVTIHLHASDVDRLLMGPLQPARPWYDRCKINFTGSARPRYGIPSATSGCLAVISRTFRLRRSRSVTPLSWP